MLFSLTPPKVCTASQTFSIACPCRWENGVRRKLPRCSGDSLLHIPPLPIPNLHWSSPGCTPTCKHFVCTHSAAQHYVQAAFPTGDGMSPAGCRANPARLQPAQPAGACVTHPAAPSLWGHSQLMPLSCQNHSVAISSCFPTLRLKLPWSSSASGEITVFRKKDNSQKENKETSLPRAAPPAA